MSFQSTVLKIATVIYCIFLISIILLMVGSSRSINYPPGVSVCPDYWKTNKDGSCSNSNSGSITLGSLASGCKNKNFSGAEFFGPTGVVNKCKWAKDCKIEWDGITNMGYC